MDIVYRKSMSDASSFAIINRAGPGADALRSWSVIRGSWVVSSVTKLPINNIHIEPKNKKRNALRTICSEGFHFVRCVIVVRFHRCIAVLLLTIYDLALGCYMGRIHFDTYLEDIQRFLEEKRFHGYVIDHADNIITNHTIYNLSLMTDNENKQKMDIVAKVKLPSRLSVAYVNGKYRLCMGTEVTNFHGIGKLFTELGLSVVPDVAATAVMQFICEDP